MEEAHEGMIADPSEDPTQCLSCHQETIDPEHYANSLHSQLWGEKKLIEERGNCEFSGAIEEGFNAKCFGCHTTCGQCHISRPNSVGGGFIMVAGNSSSHKFRGSPHMNEQCVACHGSRIGTDYLGHIEGNLPDVHYGSHLMQCHACHSGQELHGDGLSSNASGHYEHRYEVESMPRCESCHDAEGSNDFHSAHVNGFATNANLQCQVCHSQPYKNCTNCHPEPAGAGSPFTIDESTVGIKIAKNVDPNRDEYDYVVVRHAPVSTTTYDTWGLVLPELTAPTWKYASPHNIRLETAQTTSEGSCGASCHAASPTNTEIYLREADLYDEGSPLPDYNANLPIVIEDFHRK